MTEAKTKYLKDQFLPQQIGTEMALLAWGRANNKLTKIWLQDSCRYIFCTAFSTASHTDLHFAPIHLNNLIKQIIYSEIIYKKQTTDFLIVKLIYVQKYKETLLMK